MKLFKSFLLITLFCITGTVSAQDVIVKKDARKGKIMYAIYSDDFGMDEQVYQSLEEAKNNCKGCAGTIYKLKPVLGYEECPSYDFYEMKED